MERILKLDSLGYSQNEIAAALQVNQSTISRTIAQLVKRSRENIQHHIEETLPYEREKALMLLKDMKRRAVDIADNATGNRDKLSAIALVADIEGKILDIQNDGRHAKEAMEVTAKLKDRLTDLQQQQQQQEEEEEEQEEELRLYDHE